MSIPGFGEFKIDTWYKLMAIISTIILIVGLTQPIQFLSNKHVISISTGFLLYSIVEWNQHKHYTKLEPMGFLKFLKISGQIKISSFKSIFLKLISFLLVIIPIMEMIFVVDLYSKIFQGLRNFIN